MTDEIRVELEQLWAAIRALNQNDGALLKNIERLNKRLALHEAFQVSVEIQEPGRAGH